MGEEKSRERMKKKTERRRSYNIEHIFHFVPVFHSLFCIFAPNDARHDQVEK